MVMADDENSDFVGNAAEQKVIREPPQIRSPAKEKSLPRKSAMPLPERREANFSRAGAPARKRTQEGRWTRAVPAQLEKS
jgi:hypothetical protein